MSNKSDTAQPLFPMRSSPRHRAGLIDLIKNNFPSSEKLIMLQVGSYSGESAQIFLSTGKIETIYCIDPWKNGYDDNDPASRTNELAERVFDSKFKADPRVVKIKGYSYIQLPKFKENFFDLIYIDGEHSYPAVKKDIQLALPKVKSGGVLAGHDYNQRDWPCVIKAVNQALGRNPEYVFSDKSWSIHINLLNILQ